MRHLTVYGDSIAAGYGAPPGQGFVPRLASLAAQKNHNPALPYFNFGQSGMTTFALQSAFHHNDAWIGGLHRATTICVLIGGDDIIDDLPILLSRNKQAIEKALVASVIAYRAMLLDIRRQTKAPLAVGTIYNPYPGTALAETAISTYNEIVVIPAAQATGASIAPIHSAFAGNQAGLIDGYSTGIAGQPGRNGVAFPIHPNTRGHQVIAETFASVIP
ncbi:MAG: SGNH/GDSL hydrolase family protein [Acidibacillus sp.]|uniref:SGNH hydrolase-type esterase domain-containing protein n=1 Tax=Sulfoacidibacillus ferrooxidans TaxID=2005001 RepID=A0A9X1V8S2_9BACL|nr:SGNH/GDSL hydrolase family protein [Sulfoacidibacillus ferrooxidans]MCI0183315.1 hypothetical protein [Sulfoacidibacillus ferrooxidans]MCY0894006.1 SGNH/GDSL hydrolase family protein [Acidibacillus sp.]